MDHVAGRAAAQSPDGEPAQLDGTCVHGTEPGRKVPGVAQIAYPRDGEGDLVEYLTVAGKVQQFPGVGIRRRQNHDPPGVFEFIECGEKFGEGFLDGHGGDVVHDAAALRGDSCGQKGFQPFPAVGRVAAVPAEDEVFAAETAGGLHEQVDRARVVREHGGDLQCRAPIDHHRGEMPLLQDFRDGLVGESFVEDEAVDFRQPGAGPPDLFEGGKGDHREGVEQSAGGQPHFGQIADGALVVDAEVDVVEIVVLHGKGPQGAGEDPDGGKGAQFREGVPGGNGAAPPRGLHRPLLPEFPERVQDRYVAHAVTLPELLHRGEQAPRRQDAAGDLSFEFGADFFVCRCFFHDFRKVGFR